MKILITGASGQLGTELVNEFSDYFELISADRNEFDITNSEKATNFIINHKPDVVIHAAAFKDVDSCETEQDKAVSVNSTGTRNIALACSFINAKLVYISTDYVFDGLKEVPYIESDTTKPINIYGPTKLMGEKHVREIMDNHFIIRTSWLYGKNGKNFITTMLKHSREQKVLNVVSDKISTPTYAADLARQINHLIPTEQYGTYHCTSAGSCSWYEYALKIFEYSGLVIQINPIKMEEFPFHANRPKNSVLENRALNSLGLDIMPQWEESLYYFIKEVL